MRSLLFAGAAVGVLIAGPALAQVVTVGPPVSYGGYYGGAWGYGHSYGYGPGAYAYEPGPIYRPGYAWGPTYNTRSGYAAYIQSPSPRYLGGPKSPW